ncbi:hypothetical protein [Gemmobacter sp.]|uniref:hypothetical protein n=1 Tax=Gemmobacter sp. TaxID=1898957 RepID=UPI002AFDDA54|nr:hypothetical protein [Gemmobacter sp.]
MRFERLCDAPPVTVDFVDGAGGDLVIAFASVGHDPGRAPSAEFVATATGRGTVAAGRRALFVMDDSRSWANAPGLAPALHAALAQVQARAPVTRIATIGLSMGAFSALVAARILPVDVVLAFGPQWSAVPGVVPGETRWARWTAALPPVIWPVAPVGAARWTCLFHGMADDLPQAQPFPPVPGVDHLLFPGLGHSDLVPHLKARGALAGMMQAALAGDRRRLLRIVAGAGGVRRAGQPPG